MKNNRRGIKDKGTYDRRPQEKKWEEQKKEETIDGGGEKMNRNEEQEEERLEKIMERDQKTKENMSWWGRQATFRGWEEFRIWLIAWSIRVIGAWHRVTSVLTPSGLLKSSAEEIVDHLELWSADEGCRSEKWRHTFTRFKEKIWHYVRIWTQIPSIHPSWMDKTGLPALPLSFLLYFLGL